MKYVEWDEEKNSILKNEREVSFDDVLIAMISNGLLDVIVHPNLKKYPGQKIFVVNINNYVYLVPYIEDKEKYFLKTIFPSRKMTKKYLLGRK